jgi:hypothetical protein
LILTAIYLEMDNDGNNNDINNDKNNNDKDNKYKK